MCCRAKGSDCSTSLRLQFGRFLLESPGRQWAHPFQLDDQSILLLMWWRKRAADQSNAAIYRRRWCRCTNSSGSTFGVRHIMERIKRERERKRRNFFCLIRQLRTNHISPGETLLTGSQRRPARKCVQCAFNWNVTARIDRPQKEKRPPSRRISKKKSLHFRLIAVADWMESSGPASSWLRHTTKMLLAGRKLNFPSFLASSLAAIGQKRKKASSIRNSPHVCAREEKENNSFNDLILDAPTRRRAHSMPAPSIVRVTFDDSLGNATPPLRPFSYTQTRYYISSIFISLIVSIPVV